MSKAGCDIRIGTSGWYYDQTQRVRVIYAYFSNDAHGHAIKNAMQLRKLCDAQEEFAHRRWFV
ncbi:MAG: hypothetical protein ABIF19_13865 [Planctomycetota bacterium]